ncbi:MAG: ubiquinone biosynthesis accessory factor UbiJ [Burkholderiaceae bacterium]
MLDQLANASAVSVLNRMLAREQWARERLAPFAGRSARFDAAPFSLTLQVADGGTFTDEVNGEPAVTIAVAFSSLPLAMFDPPAAMKDVRLSGDAEFAQALAFVLQNLRPEPEEELSRFVGDAAAQRIVVLMRAAASQSKEMAERMLDSTAHYVVTENPMIAGKDDIETFSQDVNRLRDDVARIEKRIDLLTRA